MELAEYIWHILCAVGIPTALTGIMMRRFERVLDKRSAKAEENERNREKLQMLQIKCTMATMTATEATARAVQRIPDAHCNGDMTAALKYVKEVKEDQKAFLTELGIHALFD